MGNLTPKQKLFCEEYLKDLNATQAAIRSGYQERTATEQAARLLTNVKVKAEIRRLQAIVAKRNEVTVDLLVNELAAIAFGTLKGIVEFNNEEVRVLDSKNLTDDQWKFIGEVKPTKYGMSIRTNDKIAAINTLAKHLGMFKDDGEAIATLTTYGTLTRTENGFVFEYADSHQT